MRVHVTAEDIRDGKRRDEYECPVALACRRDMGAWSVAVMAHQMIVWQGTALDNSKRVETPGEVYEFIDKYDRRRKVAPFAFELTLPPEPVPMEVAS